LTLSSTSIENILGNLDTPTFQELYGTNVEQKLFQIAMAIPATAQAELSRLRRDIARIEGRLAEEDRLSDAMLVQPEGDAPDARALAVHRKSLGRLALGIASLDNVLGGGLPLAALSEIRAGQSRDGGVASGFALALATLLTETGSHSSLVWISETDARRETGALYAPGLATLGLDPAHVVEVAVHTEMEALWAFEAALSCRGVGVAVCELRQASLDLSATRRCALRARESGVTGLLLRLGNEWAEPSAAEIRFGVAPALAGEIGGFAEGVGRMAWSLTLEKNRLGPTGAFTVEWNAYERSFVERGEGAATADPQPLSATSADRPSNPAAAEKDEAARPQLRHAS
jgi:protein ImuA